jgi:hypothetical protein
MSMHTDLLERLFASVRPAFAFATAWGSGSFGIRHA